MAGSPSVLPTKKTFSLSVSGRVLILTIVVWVGLLAGLQVVLDRVFRPTFARIEAELLIKDLERIEAAVHREAEQLGVTAEDYASWEDMRTLVEQDSGAELPRALNRNILKTLGLDAIFVFDAVGHVKQSLLDPSTTSDTTREFTPTGFAGQFPVIASVRTQSAGDSASSARRGLVRFSNGKLVFAAAAPILPPGGNGRALGTVVMLRELDTAMAQQLGDQVRLPLQFTAADPSGPANAAKDAPTHVENGHVEAVAWLRDPFGKPIARYSVERTASILGKGEETLTVGAIGSLFMLSLVLAVLLLLLQISVVRPLRHLTRSIENVRRTGDLSLRIGMSRADEIGLLAYNFDRLLAILADRTNVLEELATTDGLTRLANRRTIMEYLTQQIERSNAESDSISVLLLDVDHFKRINDTAGHAVGDRVLRQVADTLKRTMGKDERAGRYGGEEFLVVLPHLKRGEAVMAAERIREAIQASPIHGIDWPVTVSVGVATWTGHTSHGLLATADLNLYRAKENGRNRVVADDIPLSKLPAASIPPPSQPQLRF